MRFKRKNPESDSVKEMLRYEDGEIVDAGSVKKSPQTKREKAQSDDQTSGNAAEKKEKIKLDTQKLKRYKKPLKWTLIIAAILVTAWVLWDTVQFIEEESNGQNQGENPPSETLTTPEKLVSESPNPTEEPEPVEENIPPTEATEDVRTDTPEIDAVQKLNRELLLLSATDMEKVRLYQKGQLNRISLRNRLEDSVAEKRMLLRSFVQYESVFEKEKMTAFYEETVKRSEESIALTTNLHAEAMNFDNGFEELWAYYEEVDEEMAEKQRNALILYLEQANIAYTQDPITNELNIQ